MACAGRGHMSGRFAPAVVKAIRKGKILGLRAGHEPHRVIGIWAPAGGGRARALRPGRGAPRVIGIWAVVVEGRVFVRSWSLKPRSWWRTFLEDPEGIIAV